MEKKYRPGYKTLLTSLTIATILTNARMQNVHATEEPFVNQIDVEKVILDKQLEKDLGIVDAPTDESFFNFDAWTGTITGYDTAGGLDVVIPKAIEGVEVKSIGRSAFSAKGVTSVVIPEGVTKIESDAFEHNHLLELIIPDSVTSIGHYAFAYNQLTELIIPDSVTSIGVYAFRSNQLTELIIPDSVTSIGQWAFAYNQLTELIIPDSVINIGRFAFYSNQLTELIISDSVTSIGDYAFAYNQLKGIITLNGVKSIGVYAFSSSDLIGVVFSDNLVSIGDGAFRFNNLKEVNIPNSVRSLGSEAFHYNSSLKKATIPSSVVFMGADIFKNTSPNLLLYGESGSRAESYAKTFNHKFIEMIVKDEIQTEEVAFKIEYVKNPDLLVGTEEVSQEGVNGIHTIIERVTLIGGEETNRELILNEVTTAPVNKVIQVGIKEVIEESRTEEVAFDIEYVNNPGLMVGTEEVSQEGTNGVRTIIEKVTMVEGKETGREVVSSEITTAPVNKVVQVGTKAVIEDIAKIKDGWKKEDNNWVYYKDNEKLNGWQFINSHWYFMDTSGYMKTDWTQIGSTWYYLSGSGAMQTGWTKVDNTWYYLSGSGAMQTGWTKVGNTWYYMNSSGAMQTGWTKVGNTWYYMSDSGAMQTSWTKVGNTWYYLSGSGAMQTGWLKLGQTWYFLNNDGSMQVQNKTINGKWYRFDSSGRML